MNGIEHILKGFESFSLSDLPENDLMNRYDIKYVFHISQLNDILNQAQKQYKRLNIKGISIPVYENIYFDTPRYHMYTTHHNKQLNRYKVRLRKYNDTNVYYLEIKFKNNKRFTIKTRMKTNEPEGRFNKTEREFIENNSPYNPVHLVQTVKTGFGRITLADPFFNERITIDIHIELGFKTGSEYCDDVVICEVKKSDKTKRTVFEEILFDKRIKPFGISKYCLGNYYLNENVKHNLYKEKVLLLHKILQNHG